MSRSSSSAPMSAKDAKYALRDATLPSVTRAIVAGALRNEFRPVDETWERVERVGPKWAQGAPAIAAFATSEAQAHAAGMYADDFGGSTLAVLRMADGSEWQLDVSVKCVVAPRSARS